MHSSIYHFFGAILDRRGYFPQFQNLEQFDFPDSFFAARSTGTGTFPDLVLRYDPFADLPGGEFIELKTAGAMTVSSFNSTIPMARKPMGILSKKVQDQLREAGESFDESEQRDVYYLVVGRKRQKPSPKTKVCLVNGAFFETISTKDLLIRAASQIFHNRDSTNLIELETYFEDMSADEIQSRFAATRKVDGASTKIRFRVMSECLPSSNIMNGSKFPELGDDTISMLVPIDNTERLRRIGLGKWADADDQIRSTVPYMNLSAALDDVSPALKSILSIGTLKHPNDGIYLIAQARIHA
ncbi:MAG: hypothetical protein F4W90_02480 [Gammaproteobacteria bacterium]|nr:hypothetical protein [Gammaproteobacteria bacterium]